MRAEPDSADVAPVEIVAPAAEPRGRWVRLARRAHECAKPVTAHHGDIWECECGRQWRCTGPGVFVWGYASRATWMRWSAWLPWPRQAPASEPPEPLSAPTITAEQVVEFGDLLARMAADEVDAMAVLGVWRDLTGQPPSNHP